MEGKTNVYLCSGCGIGEAFDVDELKKTIEGDLDLACCVVHDCLCGDAGLATIKEAVGVEPACNVVIGACSPRVNTDIFRFADETVVERANLREHVAWRTAADEDGEDTAMLAADTMRMSVTRARHCEVPEPFIGAISNSAILVVGGGVSGMSAALDAAKTGYEVVLVEKEATLGGYVGGLHRETPTVAPYRDLQTPRADALAKEVEACNAIKVLTGAAIKSVSGQPGMFDVIVTNAEGAEEELRIGAVVLATGAVPYDAKNLAHLGYGAFENVVTHADIEAMARKGAIIRPSDNKPARRVAFIQCAGSRDAEHLAYCSSTCCATSLKQALTIRENDPDALSYIIYKDMRTPGHLEEFYRRAQDDEGVLLTKGDVSGVSDGGDGALLVEVHDALLGGDVRIKADLVVLATGMVPSTLDNEILHLTYRKGEDLPVDKYGFPNSNFVCFPYETERTGIYAAGCVRQPMGVAESMSDAAGAALKAIQCVEMTARGEAVHPRAGDLSFPEFELMRCTQCKRCTEECPFGALDEDEKGTPEPNPNRCRRCGVCMGACPERIVNFANYNVEMVSAMIKAVEVPDEFEEKPRVLVFVCENDALPAFDLAGTRRLTYDPNIRVIPVRCLGSINVVWIKDALAAGFDGILMIGCKHGDDYQCHFIKGSELLNTRSENIQETLDSMMLESERVQTIQLALTEYDRVPEIIGEFMETIEEIGFNPFKGM